jgi:hypothetical protein
VVCGGRCRQWPGVEVTGCDSGVQVLCRSIIRGVSVLFFEFFGGIPSSAFVFLADQGCPIQQHCIWPEALALVICIYCMTSETLGTSAIVMRVCEVILSWLSVTWSRESWRSWDCEAWGWA